MLGLRLAPRLFVLSLATITLILISASMMAAQTPTAPVDKNAVASTTAVPDSAAKNTTATSATPNDETEKLPPTPIKTETEPAKENTAATNTAPVAPQFTTCPSGARVVTADVVAIPQALMLNRLGATIPNGFVFALRSDTITTAAGNLQLRPGKRPRPIVLRANVGDCLKIAFQNAIPASNFGAQAATAQSPAIPTTAVSLHIQGQEWSTGPSDDASFAGKNASSLATVPPTPIPPPAAPNARTYTLIVKNEGTFLLYTMGDTEGSPLGGQLSRGLFGALNVQPNAAEWYRSQVTQQDLALATKSKTADGQPVIDYNAVYPANTKYPDGTPIPPNTPILKMLDANNKIVHTDLTAIITGPKAGRFPGSTGVNNPEPPCNSANNGTGATNPLFCANPSSPDRKQPYREITIIYHEVGQIATQAFPVFYDRSLGMADTVNAGFDGFAINYGTGGIGAEVYANRIGVGPMGPCVDCKFEEFFLSAWSVGDPAMLVDRPANSSVLPAFTTSPAEPPVPNNPPSTAAPLVCSPVQLGDTGQTPDPNCANARVPVPGAVDGFPYNLKPLVKATKAYYADDPSNVYHSYINDHTKFRIHHGGTVATHVHHQHAHQWLQSPNSDEGSYLDSQMISPGASYTLEMTFNGSGNRNKVVGDSIFHCHFYPHFAAGMWAMWRTHDTFELGSQLDANGIPVPGTRALPDGEIKAGTPTPALVPMPTLPMAPMPSPVFIENGQIVYGTPAAKDLTGANVTANPGFPFFIPGIAGARAPHPPLDFAPDGAGGFMDGGLPRHVVTGGTIGYEKHDQFDWSKDLATMTANQLAEDGTAVEKVAMKFFGIRCRNSFFPDGTPNLCGPTPVNGPFMTQGPPKGFVLNGLPLGPQPGAPFADPAVDDNGKPINVINGKQQKRVYQAAAIQLNVTLNKKGWHFPQQRILSLWQDVKPTLAYTPGGGGRAPEPLFFRGNSGDVVEYWHTNLVPNYYLVDDFQVRTPTDILGQHIHLVKFDVTSSDGAGNGFNYEDGTFSPDEVREIIHAINANGPGGWTPCPGCAPTTLAPKPPPAPICAGPNPPSQCASEWMGAQTTIQRWYLDPVVNSQNVDRTLRTVFTHDHFGPSTHQQAGLYAGLVVEPKDSQWKSAVDNSPMGGGTITTPPVRADGGPTSWQANIITTTAADSYREFVLEFQDLQLAYDAGSRKVPDPVKSKGWRDGNHAVNPTVFPEFQEIRPRLVSTGNITPITGTQSVNYYNEPIAWRLGQFKDLSYAFDNQTALQVNPNFPNVQNPNPDPLTPLMRVYQGDNVQIRTLVGAHVFAHQFNFAGPQWFAEPSWKNSGYRSNQPMGLSEHFELLFKVPSSSAPIPVAPATTVRKCPDGMSTANCIDYFYSPSFDETGIAHGLWGLFRSYDPTATATRLAALPNNPIAPTNNVTYATCPANLPASQRRVYNITAVAAQKALSGQLESPGEIVFNSRVMPPQPPKPGGNVSTLLGVMYVRSEDLDSNGVLKKGVQIEPLVLRANAGDCIDINLTNKIDPSSKVFSHNYNWPAPFNVTVPQTSATDGTVQVPAYNAKMSKYVGLHPQLLSYDAATSFGMNVGWNSKGYADQFANFNETVKYRWYAGKIDRGANGALAYTPVEFGSLNLLPSDPMFQHPNGVFGQMIIEPPGSKWQCGDPSALGSCDGGGTVSRASATVTTPTGTFREFSIMLSDALITSAPQAINAINYRTEPVFQRFLNPNGDVSCMTSNTLADPVKKDPVTNGPVQIGDPQTPIFRANPGDQVRFRMTHPLGTGNSEVFTIHGHNWQRNPYQNNSSVIGSNNLSQWMGSRDNHGSTDHFDLVIPSAGGTSKRAGDYLYTTYLPADASAGSWGIFRVGDPPQPTGICTQAPTTEAPAPSARPPIQNLIERFRRPPLNPSGRP
jgi:manganese oxidase